MNYYPNNFYQNYPYVNSSIYPQSPQSQNPISSLNGKIVDGAEMAKVTEVPFGGYGVFPKADLSEVYIKTWNNNGTTSVATYRPIPAETVEQSSVDSTNLILERMKAIELKLDAIMNPIQQPSVQTKTNDLTPSTTTKANDKRKEVNVNAY